MGRISNQVALGLAAVIILGFLVDYLFFDWTATLFLLRKLLSLIDYLKFWR